METACNKTTMLSIHFDMWQWFDGKKCIAQRKNNIFGIWKIPHARSRTINQMFPKSNIPKISICCPHPGVE